jgi:hypothetical protein
LRLTFNLAGLDPATASISGQWATDNEGQNIRINGIDTGQTSFSFGGYTPFLINSGFVPGVNMPDFAVANNGYIAGFRVGSIIGIAELSEPGTAVLATMALVFRLRYRGSCRR